MYSNYDSSHEEVWCSWPVILLALYFFFPIGIYLIVRKSRLHRRNIFTIGHKTLASGISLMIFGFIFYIPKLVLLLAEKNFTDIENVDELRLMVESNAYATILNYGLFFVILGIVVILISIWQKRKASRYQSYISLVVNREIEDLDKIASKMNFNKDTVIKDLQTMINRRYLENYELDIDENRIYDVPKEKRRREEKDKNIRNIKCPNCGANNLLVEKYGKCEYCDSYIG